MGTWVTVFIVNLKKHFDTNICKIKKTAVLKNTKKKKKKALSEWLFGLNYKFEIK